MEEVRAGVFGEELLVELREGVADGLLGLVGGCMFFFSRGRGGWWGLLRLP